ncbi:MAG: aldehyde dehydrogenase family protein, partial [Verrucomicrobiota bacterium]
MIATATFPSQPFLGGTFASGADAPIRTLIDPATGEACGQLAEATVADVESAVLHARNAFEQTWKLTTPGRRAEVLLAIATRIEALGEQIAWADCWSMGKPITAARGEARYGATAFRHFASAIAHWGGQTVPVARGGFDYTLRVPLGVAVGIIPWNFPFPIACWKTAAALASGNCMIIKPAETTPWSALLLGQAAAEAGLPEGVLQILPGDGQTVGEALVLDPR